MAEALGVPVDTCRSTRTSGEFYKGRVSFVVRGPSPTVTFNVSKKQTWQSSGVPFINGPDRRRLTVSETARLQDFPAGHPFQGPQTAKYRQIANAVPPRLAEAVGRAVMQAEAPL
jgi:site-specific DNA-cytosine methylase